MTDWKDTVMTMDEVKVYLVQTGKMEIIQAYNLEQLERFIHAAINRQAKISFKASIREVVEWIGEYSQSFIVGQDIAIVAGNDIKGDTSYYPIIRWLDWRAKLQEWGIEDVVE